jgi:hypothetical protein
MMIKKGMIKFRAMKFFIMIKPAMYPIGIDPTSPRNIFAGGLLKVKKAKKMESMIILKYWKSELRCPNKASKFVVIAKEQTWMVVIPSIPSIKLNRLIIQSQKKIKEKEIMKKIMLKLMPICARNCELDINSLISSPKKKIDKRTQKN